MNRAFVIAIVASAGLAQAEPSVTVMWAPLRLIIPLGEMTAEYRVQPKVGVSATFGGGRRTMVAPNMTDVPGTEIEGGAQARYYVLGSFRKGMEVGAEALYEYVHFQEPFPQGVVAAAAGGLTIGPFVGYKIIGSSGFTFEGQIGARYLAMEPSIQGSAMGASLPINDKWLPLLHLNVGWSF